MCADSVIAVDGIVQRVSRKFAVIASRKLRQVDRSLIQCRNRRSIASARQPVAYGAKLVIEILAVCQPGLLRRDAASGRLLYVVLRPASSAGLH